jgi:hypothetical protein
MIKHFKHRQVEFSYPENWVLVPPENDDLPHEISLESPEGCLWVVHVFPTQRSPQELLDEALKVLQGNYQDFEFETVTPDIEPAPALAVQADFFCLDFLVTARVMVFQQPPLLYVVI